MRVLVTRPEPDATAQAEALIARGHEPIIAPLLVIHPAAETRLPLDDVAALIVTSRNALRALSSRPDIEALRSIPLYAVGARTAREAAQRGFKSVTQGPGTAEALAALIARHRAPGGGALLHLSGADISFNMTGALERHGFAARQVIAYHAEAVETLPGVARDALATGTLRGVILMSPRTARIYGNLVQLAGLEIEAESVTCFCISPAAAEALPFRAPARVAPRPHADDLLSLIDEA